MKIKNIEAAKELVKRYRSVTASEIDDVIANSQYMSLVPTKLTGFGSTARCTLCKEVGLDCEICVYSLIGNNLGCIMDKTYKQIDLATNTEEFLIAFSDRADYLESVIKKAEEL